MKAVVEQIGSCLHRVTLEIEVETVNAAIALTAAAVAEEVTIAGYRRGGAPIEMVMLSHPDRIHRQAVDKLVKESFAQVVADRQMDVVGKPDVESLDFRAGAALKCELTVETVPEFELPPYESISVEVPQPAEPTEAEITAALEELREQARLTRMVDRGAIPGDIIVVNFTASLPGQTATTYSADEKHLLFGQGMKLKLDVEHFIPGFCARLVGCRAGERREFALDFPSYLPSRKLAGRRVTYATQVIEVREEFLPPPDEEFARRCGCESLQHLRDQLRQQLRRQNERHRLLQQQEQAVQRLINATEFDVPPSALAQEMRNAVERLNQMAQQSGASTLQIEREKDSLYEHAVRSAKELAKARYLFRKIAERENLTVSAEDLRSAVHALAAAKQQSPEATLRNLQHTNQMTELHDQLLHDKVIAFLVARFATAR